MQADVLILIHHLPGVLCQLCFTRDVRVESHEEIQVGTSETMHDSTPGEAASCITSLEIYLAVQTVNLGT